MKPFILVDVRIGWQEARRFAKSTLRKPYRAPPRCAVTCGFGSLMKLDLPPSSMISWTAATLNLRLRPNHDAAKIDKVDKKPKKRV
jgi:hypothetical protein